MTEDDDTDVDDISDDNPFCECGSDGYSIEEIDTGVCDYCGKFLDDFLEDQEDLVLYQKGNASVVVICGREDA